MILYNSYQLIILAVVIEGTYLLVDTEKNFIEDYKIVKKILDYLGIYEFERKKPPPMIEDATGEFDEYIRDDYIGCDHVC